MSACCFRVRVRALCTPTPQAHKVPHIPIPRRDKKQVLSPLFSPSHSFSLFFFRFLFCVHHSTSRIGTTSIPSHPQFLQCTSLIGIYNIPSLTFFCHSVIHFPLLFLLLRRLLKQLCRASVMQPLLVVLRTVSLDTSGRSRTPSES